MTRTPDTGGPDPADDVQEDAAEMLLTAVVHKDLVPTPKGGGAALRFRMEPDCPNTEGIQAKTIPSFRPARSRAPKAARLGRTTL